MVVLGPHIESEGSGPIRHSFHLPLGPFFSPKLDFKIK